MMELNCRCIYSHSIFSPIVISSDADKVRDQNHPFL